MKKSILSLLFLALLQLQSFPVKADMVLSPSGLTVLDTATGSSWYRFFDDFYFGSIYGSGPGTPAYQLNNQAYDGKTNWTLATIDQIRTLLTSILPTPSGPADISSLFIPAPWTRGGGHYNPDWTIGPRWGGLTDTVVMGSGGVIVPNEHVIYTLDFYKSIGPQPSYYSETLGVGADSGSGPYGSWLVAAGTIIPPVGVPEPLALVLFVTGLAGLAAFHRKAKRTEITGTVS